MTIPVSASTPGPDPVPTSIGPAGATVYGYPRQGRDRQLKQAVESYWAGSSNAEALLATAVGLRHDRLRELRDAGLTEIPVNEFSLYDHMLDTAWMLGAIPDRHHRAVPDVDTPAAALDRYFAMARGNADVAPLEMTKWFDTNYHYLVPELGPDTVFTLDPGKPLTELREARSAGALTRPVLVGPFTFLLLAKPAPGVDAGFDSLDLLERLVPLYADLLRQLADAGAGWVQIDEPVLVTDQPARILDLVTDVYRRLTAVGQRPKILLASYFDELGDAMPALVDSGVDGLALDFTGAARANLDRLVRIGGLPGRLVAGVIDGRNVWRADLDAALDTLTQLAPLAGQLDVAASCSLLHVPLDVSLEHALDLDVASWLAFAHQKLGEITTLAHGVSAGAEAIGGELAEHRRVLAARAASPVVRRPQVRDRVDAVTDADLRRGAAFAHRHALQQQHLRLPQFPTTTIGSFPQTPMLRTARARLRRGTLDDAAYAGAIRAEIRSVVALQNEIGLDVLVHGEPERNDMVQYFAEQLDGFVTTEHGWVQSYGSRYVRPPIVVGDVFRSAPMTVVWSGFAQSLTDKPVKAMLTGPVTMLAWSFVRNDQPRSQTARQVALALRDEVADLEAAGLAVIQVDEPALRETLPLRESGRAEYLRWAVDAFRLTTAGVADRTQLHTHMCYAEFDDILAAMVEMDADVISLEAARSDLEVVEQLSAIGYPNDVGPGVWDIHSPRIPTIAEIIDRLSRFGTALPAERIWVNPDCGLKTRGYREVTASLRNLVEATRAVRAG